MLAQEAGEWAQSSVLAKQLNLPMKKSLQPGGGPCSGHKKQPAASEKTRSEVRGQIAENQIAEDRGQIAEVEDPVRTWFHLCNLTSDL